MSSQWETFFRDQLQVCPGCGAAVSFETSNGGTTVDVLHPQPPCEEFRAFVHKLEALAGVHHSRAPKVLS